MQEWLRRGSNPQRLRHRVASKFRFGALQRPRRMMNLAPNDLAAAIARVKAVPLGQEILERPTPWRKNLSGWAIPALQQSRWHSAMRPLALVMNPAFPFCAAHSCSKIWQVKPRARDGNRQRVTSVQTEKPHAGLFAESHIGANIQFWECREPRHRGRPAQPHTGHPKRNYREPSLPFKSVDLQLPRQKRAQQGGVDRPMRK